MSDQDNTRSAIERHQQEQRLISVLADEFRDLHDAPSDVPLDTLDDIYAAVHRLREGPNPQPALPSACPAAAFAALPSRSACCRRSPARNSSSAFIICRQCPAAAMSVVG